MAVTLNTDILGKLSRAFEKDSSKYKAIVAAAEKSSYLAGELNAFGVDKNWEIKIGEAGKGVYTDPSKGIVVIASDWNESGDKFATTLAHELGHALLQNGSGGPTPNTPKDAIANMHVNEGVALTSEYIVAVQLGLIGGSAGNMHSDGGNVLTPQLSSIAKSLGINVGTLLYGSSDALKLTSPTSKFVEAGGAFYSTLPPSGAPYLTYDQYAADWWILGHCGITPQTVDWPKIKGPTITYSDTTVNGKPACLINTEKIPFLPGSGGTAATLQISGAIVSDGYLTASLFGMNGQIIEQLKYSYSGFKVQDIYFGSNGKPLQQFDFKLDNSYTRYDFAADGSQTATLYGTAGQIVEIAKFNASGFKLVDTFFGSNGKATQQFEFRTDKSYTKYDFAADGSQTATLYGTTGQIVEIAQFNASGFKLVDTFFGSSGKATQQFEFKTDKSYTKYDFAADGSQTATLYGTTGQIVEMAQFNASGFKTVDTFFGSNGKAT
uniref:ImmA/IrrE family metallo-endopeptidase n=1 Tax=Paraburkholderia sp. J63 TaxID=2805434 RepID=UPI002ABEA0DD